MVNPMPRKRMTNRWGGSNKGNKTRAEVKEEEVEKEEDQFRWRIFYLSKTPRHIEESIKEMERQMIGEACMRWGNPNPIDSF